MKTPNSGMLIYISPPNPQNMKITVLVNDLTKKRIMSFYIEFSKGWFDRKNHFWKCNTEKKIDEIFPKSVFASNQLAGSKIFQFEDFRS